jgi:hypothetical protein
VPVRPKVGSPCLLFGRRCCRTGPLQRTNALVAVLSLASAALRLGTRDEGVTEDRADELIHAALHEDAG